MGKSPGHQQHPEHRVLEQHVGQPMEVHADGEVLAESMDAIRVDEDGYPPRYYFPRQDVHKAGLQPSDTHTQCPFKGTASYFDLTVGDHTLKDAIWSYEDPYDEHADLKDRLAFDAERYPELRVVTQGSNP
jgi:uncharacterized protein (DUF427 family)